MSRRLSDDRGASLVEVLVAVIVLGTAAAAAVGGLFTAIRVSDVHRDQSEAATVARHYTELIAGTPHLDCGTAAAAYADFADDVAPADPGKVYIPPGFSVSVGPIESRTGTTWGACVNGELQRVTVVLTSGDGVSERSVVVVRAP
jgi:prepilin-type N-terminal cleavage/methylation domain-containing protein